jgi:hypothetical protein
MTTHRHRADPTRERLMPYMGGAQNQRHAGGVTYEDHCACGAVRITHSNGGSSESSGWFALDSATDRLRDAIESETWAGYPRLQR